jgi:Dit-like phage tail protein
MVSITVPSQPAVNNAQTVQADPNVPGGYVLQNVSVGPTTYVFDAVLDLEHEQRIEKTHHPVQTGADLSSHAYLMPAKLTMFVGMSDAMQAYSAGANPAQSPYITSFSGNPSKSVAAYQQMLSLQAARVPLIVTTRLRTYKNMIIVSVGPREDAKTITGLRMRIEFEQIFTATTADVANSARSNSTDSTGLGAVNAQTPSTTTVSQFNVTAIAQTVTLTSTLLGYLRSHPQGVNVPGAGTYSSVNTNNLQQLPAP